ncbi:MAG: sugar transferase [Verrucomicrobiae bacterium]|nr:sugar transferase [Verrucomicrobiae bacterium]
MEPIPLREGSHLEGAEGESSVRVACMPRWKRVLDLTFVVGTAMIWLPVFVMGAIWVRMVSGGPILFRQTRIGVGEVPFTMLKLRTMHANAQTSSHENHVRDLIASDAKMTKLDVLGDSRLIFGGRLLRTLSIDEIPQFFNVLGGTMSVVGPRPCTKAELERYLPHQKERFSVHPGLTGHWQVFGKNQTTFSEMINMDIKYARDIRLSRELLIIGLTPFAILKDFVLTLEALFQAKRTRTKSLETHNK